MTQRERHAIVCCQGGSSAGLGHVRRSLSLARALRNFHGVGVTFAAPREVAVMILAAGFAVRPDVPLIRLAEERKFDLAVVDVKDAVLRADVAALAAKIPVVAVIDDGSDRRLAATHAYYPPTPQARELSWVGSSCKPRLGWEWCILGFDPMCVPSKRKDGNAIPRIVVSVGGADPLKFTVRIADALTELKQNFVVDFVIGPVFAEPGAVRKHIQAVSSKFRVVEGGRNPENLFMGADLALIAFGVTAYEVAALGVPALYLPLSEDHVRSASAFLTAGIGQALPLSAGSEQIAQVVMQLLEDEPRRRAMAAAGRRQIDGKGAVNIAANLTQAVEAG